MRNPTRKNRNIGTAKQGYGVDNKLRIPGSHDTRAYYERLVQYSKHEVIINEHAFLFVVEETREGVQRVCSIEDIKQIMEQIPAIDYGELRLIVLRQPKRKEELLSPVWGRLIYFYEFENDYYPAIILEAVDREGKLKWPKSLSVDDQKELERLKKDRHSFIEDGKYLVAELLPENVKRTQLFRTLPHEFGYYVHYLSVVERPGTEEEAFEVREQRGDYYFKSIPTVEKEKFAHGYAEKLRGKLCFQR